MTYISHRTKKRVSKDILICYNWDDLLGFFAWLSKLKLNRAANNNASLEWKDWSENMKCLALCIEFQRFSYTRVTLPSKVFFIFTRHVLINTALCSSFSSNPGERLFRMTSPLFHAVSSLPRGRWGSTEYWADCVSVLPTTAPWFIPRPCRGNRITPLIRVISPRLSLGEYMQKHQEIAANIRANVKLSVTLRLHRAVAVALILTGQ